MTLYAVIDGGQLVGEREIANYAGLPDYKKAALDEKGDGGPTLRPIVVSGSGPIKTQIIDQNQVRWVYGWDGPSLAGAINAERDRRLAVFHFGGHSYQFTPESRLDVAGAGSLAQGAIIMGAQVGDLRWADPDRDFTWITADNQQVTMDAQTCFAFAKTAALWRADHIYAARALKDTNPIPETWANDAHWPAA